MSHPILDDAQAKMTKAVDHTLHEFSAIHTGKASPTMVESVMVEAYGSMMRLKECAAISTPLPEMSRERRQEFVKTAHKLAEEGRVQVRNLRRDAIENVKKAKLPEDDAKRLEKDIQAATDASIKSINDHLAHKEKDLLTV